MTTIHSYNDLTSSELYQKTAALASAGYETTCNYAGIAYEKVSDLAQRYLTVGFLTEKARNALKAKVNPLSDPPGWTNKMRDAQAKVKRLKVFKSDTEKLVESLDHQLSSLHRASDKVIASLREQRSRIEERYQSICESLQEAERTVSFLERQKNMQITSRFSGYLGWMTDAFLPGAGIVAGLALTTATVAAQETTAAVMLQEGEHATIEKRSVRIGTMCTAACTVASVAFSLWLLPVAKVAIREMLS